MNTKTLNDDEKIIEEKEKKYFQEISDFEKFWYLGCRFQYNQFSGYVNAPFNSETLNISNQGFREKKILNKNISKKKRVGIFGPSGVVGIPVANDNNNISSFSNMYFEENGYEFVSLNFGVMAARIGDESKLISKILIEFDLDYVVLMSGFNDISAYILGSLWEFDDISDVYKSGFKINQNLNKPGFFFKNFWKSIKRKKEILNAKKLATNKFKGASKYFKSKWAKKVDGYSPIPVFKEGKVIYLSLLNQIISMCKFMKKPFLFILQPCLFNTNKFLSTYESAAFRKQNNFFGDNEEKKNYRIEMFREFYSEIENDCNNLVIESGSKILNIEKKFQEVSKDRDIFYDESHYFEEGNKIIGEEISKIILQYSQ